MTRSFGWALICACVVTGPALAQSNWTGNVDDDWANAGNWDNGIPSSAPNLRARIKKTSDTGNWPVIKTGATINQGGRIQAPFAASALGSNETSYSRLTVQSGGSLTVGDDFLFGEGDGTATEPIVGSLNVAGSLSVNERMRFGHSAFTTLDVDVTGTMTQTAVQDFRIATGGNSVVDFDISGNGVVTTAGEFEMGSGGSLSLADNARLILREFDTTTKADLIALISGYVGSGLIQGLPGYYSGPETLTRIGSGVAYFEGADRVTFVAAIPEPSTLPLVALTAFVGVRYRRRSTI